MNCVRKRIVIGGENFYLVVGQDFVTATVPYENRPENQKLREIVDELCKHITEALGGETDEP